MTGQGFRGLRRRLRAAENEVRGPELTDDQRATRITWVLENEPDSPCARRILQILEVARARRDAERAGRSP